MPRRSAAVSQSDIASALRAAQKAGPGWYVEIEGAVIRIIQGEPPSNAAAELEAPFTSRLNFVP